MLQGFMFSYVMKLSHRKGWLDRESYIAQYLAFAILTIGIASTLGSDDLLAAFAAGKSTTDYSLFFSKQLMLLRYDDFMGRTFQSPDRRGSIFIYYRLGIELRKLHLYRSLAST